MKKIMLSIIFCYGVCQVNAQTLSEWFRQKKTQKKYLIEQIAALKMYGGHLKSGYKIAQKGLTTIVKIKQGDLDQHHDFFASLKAVNPAIKNNPRIHQMEVMHGNILRQSKISGKEVKQDNLFNKSEATYVQKVFQNLLDGCDDILTELSKLTGTASEEEGYQMSDDQRLSRLDLLYRDMLDRYLFAEQFGKKIAALASLRKLERHNIERLRVLNNIKK